MASTALVTLVNPGLTLLDQAINAAKSTMKTATAMKNLFESILEDLDNEVFEDIVSSESVKVERIVSKGHRSPASGWYDQERHEWVVVLKGKAVLAFEYEEDLVLRPGDHVDIPAHKKHRVKWTDPNQETIWLAVHYR
ncbi:hypothetical protein GCM10007160_05000 [Litchfieldella qijiaojingensis]|uniref:Cupin type-2 domain-containing protein n=1 Tax=Litchfieldella qijiaojingensis TaxID=980347 RepID=A0ABQ2YFQ4_9GAMM|nr:cupin domain-containing protein [Halomonas qijiaojingensis]GGX80799.1 hypothetical protein GCM10007160_05000 [Halomonas qijiaojingensis]